MRACVRACVRAAGRPGGRAGVLAYVLGCRRVHARTRVNRRAMVCACLLLDAHLVAEAAVRHYLPLCCLRREGRMYVWGDAEMHHTARSCDVVADLFTEVKCTYVHACCDYGPEMLNLRDMFHPVIIENVLCTAKEVDCQMLVGPPHISES